MPFAPIEIFTPAENLVRRKRRAKMRSWLGNPTKAQRLLLDNLLNAMVVDFKNHGPSAIAAVRDKDPVNYLRLMIALVHKPLIDLETERLFSNDDVADALARLDQIAERFALDFHGVGDGADDPLPAADLQPLPEAE